MLRDRVKGGSSCCCVVPIHLFTSMMFSLLVALAFGLLASTGIKYGWAITADTYDITVFGEEVIGGTMQLNYGWKEYCYKVSAVDVSFKSCQALDESVSFGDDSSMTAGTLELGSASLKKWGNAVATVTFWTNAFAFGSFVGFLLLNCNIKPLCGLDHARIFGLGSLISGISLAITVSGFYYHVSEGSGIPQWAHQLVVDTLTRAGRLCAWHLHSKAALHKNSGPSSTSHHNHYQMPSPKPYLCLPCYAAFSSCIRVPKHLANTRPASITQNCRSGFQRDSPQPQQIFKRVGKAYDTSALDRPMGPAPNYAWFLQAFNCLTFLGWGCSYLGSFGATVDNQIRAAPKVREQHHPNTRKSVVLAAAASAGTAGPAAGMGGAAGMGMMAVPAPMVGYAVATVTNMAAAPVAGVAAAGFVAGGVVTAWPACRPPAPVPVASVGRSPPVYPNVFRDVPMGTPEVLEEGGISPEEALDADLSVPSAPLPPPYNTAPALAEFLPMGGDWTDAEHGESKRSFEDVSLR
ncbi:unnamed protein product [Phaeothamnion confervicola]